MISGLISVDGNPGSDGEIDQFRISFLFCFRESGICSFSFNPKKRKLSRFFDLNMGWVIFSVKLFSNKEMFSEIIGDSQNEMTL
jgi:hypothetical protein